MFDRHRAARFFLRILGWGFASLLFLVFGYLFILRPWHLHWNATPDEISRQMPGDDVIPDPSLNTTRAITIRARPEEIWPWLVQMGSGRAGWYSYDRLDNGGRRSADHLVPELQTPLRVGDHLPVWPRGQFHVLAVEENRYLVLGPQAVWTFALYPQADGGTRMVQRLRTRYYWRHPMGIFWAAILDPGDFIMMRKMLLNLKQRAESNRRQLQK